MSKHLKLKGVYDPLKKVVKVSVLEQTHFGSNFGPTTVDHVITGHGAISFRHKGMCIYSDCWCSLYYFNHLQYANDTARYWFGLPSQPESICEPVEVPLDEWPLLKEAVEEYNKWGDTQ